MLGKTRLGIFVIDIQTEDGICENVQKVADLSNVPHLAGFACIFLSNPHSCTLALR